MKRCFWARETDPLLCGYHDDEYGRVRRDDGELFEKLCLECFQAGLSWRIVLAKRDALRARFYGFDAARMARMTPADVEAAMADASIIRNRRKIEAVIGNARRQLAQFPEPGDFARFVYAQTDGEALSKSLKRMGYRFVGPVICASFLQSVGALEGHESQCFLRSKGLCRHT